MISFELQLRPIVWTEILKGASGIAFDCKSSKRVELHFSEDNQTPDATCFHTVDYFPSDDWDFERFGLTPGVQRIWARGDTVICGIRARNGEGKNSTDKDILDVLCRIETELELHRELIKGLG